MGNYTQPTVDQIFAAGVPASAINPSQFFNPNAIYNNPAEAAGLYLNETFAGLYYNITFLFPAFPYVPDFSNNACTADTCSLLFGNFLYLPNVPANAFFAALFGIFLIAQIVLSIRQKAWGYLAGMVGGLFLEILGYTGRVLLHNDDFSSNPFYIYIIGLTIGPAFLSASIYLCLARIIGVYGRDLSRFKPKTYTKIFIGCDFFSLVLQSTGGGMAASFQGGSSGAKAGINIMIAGLAFQVVSLTVFMALCADFAFAVSRSRDLLEPEFRTLRSSSKFKGFIASLILATITIYARSIFRVVELKAGFSSRLANDEITFMVLEAAMISSAVILMTAFHPTIVFGSLWGEVSNVIKKGGRGKEEPAGSARSMELVGSNAPMGNHAVYSRA